ncbi:MAG TPA: hypothetical protein VKN99_20720 [Polyangia bacterium]|nr:hypothetical protein [Polyangia bacterium]
MGSEGGLVRVLRTSVRPRMDAACSLLQHDGIPYRLREARELVAYLPLYDDLQLYVPAERAQEAAALIALLDQPAHPADQPYRSVRLEGEPDPEPGPDPTGDDSARADEERRARVRERTRSALILCAICVLALAAVTIGLSLAYREWLAPPDARVTPMSTRYGAFREP